MFEGTIYVLDFTGRNIKIDFAYVKRDFNKNIYMFSYY